MRRYFIDCTSNTRDIGGYTIENEKRVKEGLIIRSNCITELDEKYQKKLNDMNFKIVIDLRTKEEITRKKSVFENNKNFEYYNIRIKGNGRIPENKELMLTTYIEMLDGKEQIKEIFDILEKSKYGIIYHCSAGKDRTGVVTALILKLLGVKNEEIIVDYMASGVFYRDNLLEFAKKIKKEENKDVWEMITPTYERMDSLLKYIDKEYGSVENYLKSCGLTDETLNNIRTKYTMEDNI